MNKKYNFLKLGFVFFMHLGAREPVVLNAKKSNALFGVRPETTKKQSLGERAVAVGGKLATRIKTGFQTVINAPKEAYYRIALRKDLPSYKGEKNKANKHTYKGSKGLGKFQPKLESYRENARYRSFEMHDYLGDIHRITGEDYSYPVTAVGVKKLKDIEKKLDKDGFQDDQAYQKALLREAQSYSRPNQDFSRSSFFDSSFFNHSTPVAEPVFSAHNTMPSAASPESLKTAAIPPVVPVVSNAVPAERGLFGHVEPSSVKTADLKFNGQTAEQLSKNIMVPTDINKSTLPTGLNDKNLVLPNNSNLGTSAQSFASGTIGLVPRRRQYFESMSPTTSNAMRVPVLKNPVDVLIQQNQK